MFATANAPPSSSHTSVAGENAGRERDVEAAVAVEDRRHAAVARRADLARHDHRDARAVFARDKRLARSRRPADRTARPERTRPTTFRSRDRAGRSTTASCSSCRRRTFRASRRLPPKPDAVPRPGSASSPSGSPCRCGAPNRPSARRADTRGSTDRSKNATPSSESSHSATTSTSFGVAHVEPSRSVRAARPWSFGRQTSRRRCRRNRRPRRPRPAGERSRPPRACRSHTKTRLFGSVPCDAFTSSHAPSSVTLGLQAPIGMIGPFVDQRVGRLRGADAVEIDLVVVVLVFELRRRCRLGVAAIVEAAAVEQPRCARKLTPANLIVEIVAGRDFADAPGHPIRTRGRRRVRHVAAVVGERRFR